jgi:chromosome segregation ATPase
LFGLGSKKADNLELKRLKKRVGELEREVEESRRRRLEAEELAMSVKQKMEEGEEERRKMRKRVRELETRGNKVRRSLDGSRYDCRRGHEKRGRHAERDENGLTLSHQMGRRFESGVAARKGAVVKVAPSDRPKV